jgi:hypothetical protein
MSRAILLWVATKSPRNRAFRHKERGALVRSAWLSAMRQIWWDAMPDHLPNAAQGKMWQEDGRIMYRVPSGSGDRAIVSHLGSAETGILDGCLLLYNGSKSNNNADYHSQMNASVFLDCLQKKVFPKMKELGKKCALVLGRATYHTRLTPHTKRMRKS